MKVKDFLRRSLVAVLFAGFLSGCATTSPSDPLEPVNRVTFAFNELTDEILFKPIAIIYSDLTPNIVQTGVGNFFSNIGDLWVAVNNFMQGKPSQGMSDVARVFLNSTMGIGGLIDVASDFGYEKHDEDFGQTLAVWGVPSGPYLVVPFWGATTIRDGVGSIADGFAYPWNYIRADYTRAGGIALKYIDKRAKLLDAGNLLNDVSVDKYTFFRESYLQHRQSLVNDSSTSSENLPNYNLDD